jgi:hypothetical protein
VRRGRTRPQRALLAETLIELAARHLNWPTERFVLEFTEHAGDQMYRD